MRADDAPTPEVVQAPLAQLSPQCRDNSGDDADVLDVLDVPQVATWLRVGRNTVYALVARNAIPHRRLGKTIRFSRRAVMSWLSTWQGAKEGK
jgi:excisionase family DNA binding protein